MRQPLVTSVLPAVYLLTALPLIAGDGAIPIWEPTTITEPGSYIVTRDISNGGNVIEISANNVDLDLGGFTLDGGVGVVAWDVSAITVRNGKIDTGEGVGIDFYNVNGFSIRKITDTNWDDQAWVIHGTNGIIEDNHFLRDQDGFYVYGSKIIIRRNILTGWIWLDADHSVVCDNIASGVQVGWWQDGGDDNQILRNNLSGGGLHVAGHRNLIGGNLITNGFEYGVYITGNDNVHRGNIARGGNGDPASCDNPEATADFCDEGTNNTSHGDNYMPDQR